MNFESRLLKGTELMKELDKLVGQKIHLSYGNYGGVTVGGTLEEKKPRIEEMYSYPIGETYLNIWERGEYDFRLEDSYTSIGFPCYLFIKDAELY